MSSLDSPQDTYWPIPKLTDHMITFLHCCHLWRAVSSHSKIFSHLSFHLRNLWYNASLTVQSIFGPSIYGMYILLYTGCGAWGWVQLMYTSCSNFDSSCVLDSSWLASPSVSVSALLDGSLVTLAAHEDSSWLVSSSVNILVDGSLFCLQHVALYCSKLWSCLVGRLGWQVM